MIKEMKEYLEIPNPSWLKDEFDQVDKGAKIVYETYKKDHPEYLALYPNELRNAKLRLKSKAVLTYILTLVLWVVLIPPMFLLLLFRDIVRSICFGRLGEIFPFSRTEKATPKVYCSGTCYMPAQDGIRVGITTGFTYSFKNPEYKGLDWYNISDHRIKDLPMLKEANPKLKFVSQDRIESTIYFLGIKIGTVNHESDLVEL